MESNSTINSEQPATSPAPAAAPAAVISIEADEADALDHDSAFGDDASDASSRTSLSSGIARYRVENGRRYHAYKSGNYLLVRNHFFPGPSPPP